MKREKNRALLTGFFWLKREENSLFNPKNRKTESKSQENIGMVEPRKSGPLETGFTVQEARNQPLLNQEFRD
jgi:hypothetical protein